MQVAIESRYRLAQGRKAFDLIFLRKAKIFGNVIFGGARRYPSGASRLHDFYLSPIIIIFMVIS